MDCRDYREKMPEYNKGLLNPEQIMRFEKHLGLCPMCRREAARERRLSTLLEGWTIPEKELGFDAQLAAGLASIKEKERKRGDRWWRKLISPWTLRLAYSGLAAAVIIVGVILAGRLRSDFLFFQAGNTDLIITQEMEVLQEFDLLRDLELFEYWEEIEGVEPADKENS